MQTDNTLTMANIQSRSARLDCLRFAVDLAKCDPIIPGDEDIIKCAQAFFAFVNDGEGGNDA